MAERSAALKLLRTEFMGFVTLYGFCNPFHAVLIDSYFRFRNTTVLLTGGSG